MNAVLPRQYCSTLVHKLVLYALPETCCFIEADLSALTFWSSCGCSRLEQSMPWRIRQVGRAQHLLRMNEDLQLIARLLGLEAKCLMTCNRRWTENCIVRPLNVPQNGRKRWDSAYKEQLFLVF